MKKLLSLIVLLFISANLFAANRSVNLVVGYLPVKFADEKKQALAINNQIPAPTLYFKEGDRVTINVVNQLKEETALHWHGLLVPWQMDGVFGVSQHGIKPGESFQYQFTLYQSGTYWYHAHAGLQEQQGLYGALIIEPRKKPSYRYNKDHVIVLSDWSNTHPDQILSNLKKEGDYYSPRFPLQPSLMKFIHDYRKASASERKSLIDDYKMMQDMRMSIYDLSDVAYDAFLLNGKINSNPWKTLVKVGDTVRLRFIGAGANTLFRVKIPNTIMQVVHVQGNDVKPYHVSDFTLAPGETVDVLIKIKKNEPYIIYAESADTLGHAIGALITKPNQFVNFKVTPFPEPLPVTREMMSQMMGDHGAMSPMSHTMPTESSQIGDVMENPESAEDDETSTDIKYQKLKAAVKTNNPNKPIKNVIRMELFGYMDRFIWFINGVPEHKAKPIILEPNQRYRFIFTNTSMMHHPMHIHGHWFILRKGLGQFDPLLHTIDVAPNATIVADVDTDANGQWLFHCHFLYHMMSGMARTFQYSTLIELTKNEKKPQNMARKTSYHNRPIVRIDDIQSLDNHLVEHPMPHQAQLWSANFLDVGVDPFHNAEEVTFKGLYGGDYHKLELLMDDAEINKGKVENADVDIFYWRLINQFWAVKGGINYFYRPARVPYWQAGLGVEGLMPYFIDLDARAYHYAGITKLDIELARDTQITNQFFIRLGLRSIFATESSVRAELGSGLNQMRYSVRPYYRLKPGLDLFIEYEYEKSFGNFRKIERQEGGLLSENTMTLGLSLLF